MRQSGNFLYVTLRLLKDLEQEAIRWGAERLRIPGEFPRVDPHNVLGIEINPYARELAGVSIWIGHIQWMQDHGYGFPRDPVLQPLDNIEQRDAILARDDEGVADPGHLAGGGVRRRQPPVPRGEAKVQRPALGDDVPRSAVREAWRVMPSLRGADLVCYWHELARRRHRSLKRVARRAGLLATNSDPRRLRIEVTLDRDQGQRRHLHGVVGRALDLSKGLQSASR